ncbi:MAG TPA: methyltransferase domain-containing protein, partial [Longimicrobiales bacterium]|nr:methyltransferase domain-containing protein [Longimicrobiales bacterium]
NLPLLVDAVGPEGRVIGVDLTDAMLEKARERVAAAGWANVELVESDAAAFDFPSGTGGVLSMLALTLVPEYDDIVRRGAEALRPGGRIAIFDMKEPASWPRWLVRLVAWLNRPFGVSMDLADRHPWESVRGYLREIDFRELHGGALYLSVGERPAD